MIETQEKTFSEPLSERERATLCRVVGHMIPASTEYGVPGADDPQIFQDIVRSVARDRVALADALRVVDEMAGGALAALPKREQAQCLDEFRAAHPALAGVIESLTAHCYYRDDRVLTSIGVEPRPPFPAGYEVEQGNWSLLEPVRTRGKIYRDAE